jgi:chromosome segregation ATPase
VIAISADNESVDQKQVVSEATGQIKEELSGLDTAVEAANEFQEESDELAAQDRQRIKRDVNAAVAGGEKELRKLKKRVSSLEEEVARGATDVEKLQNTTTNLTTEQKRLEKSNSEFTAGQKEFEAELAELEEQIAKLEKRIE